MSDLAIKRYQFTGESVQSLTRTALRWSAPRIRVFPCSFSAYNTGIPHWFRGILDRLSDYFNALVDFRRESACGSYSAIEDDDFSVRLVRTLTPKIKVNRGQNKTKEQ